MRKPNVGKQRSASGAFSLSRKLPKLNLPTSIATGTPGNKVRSPKVGRPSFGKPR